MKILIAGAVFVVAFAVRWVTLSGLQGDDHWPLWTAATFLKGDLPFRDFVDLGDPLYWGMSALAQAIAGYRVIGEVVLGTALVAFAFAIAFHLAWRASGSAAVAAGLAALALLAVTPRELYGYPKLFVYPLALWLCWRYIDRPTLLRSATLAFGVAVAFGYRHDHGAYAGVGAAAAVLAAHWPDGPRRILLAWLRFGVALLLLLSPYLALIQAHEGIVQYFRDRTDLARRLDATSRRLVWFSVDSAAPTHWLRIEPPRPARVIVDWKAEVTPETRVPLEHTYSLTNGLDPKTGRRYEYFLTDVSRDTLTALLADPRIVDQRGIATVSRQTTDGSEFVSDVMADEELPPDAPPAARARVAIQWSASVPEAERAALERQYGLLDPTPERQQWDYALTNVSARNIRAIVEDPNVYDTGLIDRDTYRPMEEGWLVRLQRAIPLARISIAPRYWHADNAGIALHYLSLALPYLLLIMLATDRIRGRRGGRMVNAPAKMFAAAVMAAVVHIALLRRTGYFADHAALTAILGACVLGHAFGGARLPRPAVARIGAGAIAGIVLVLSLFATITYARGTASLADVERGVLGLWDKSAGAWRSYTTSPPIDEMAPRGSTGDRGLMRYIYECTRPDDRVWVLSDLFAFPYYTERRVVGHIYWAAAIFTTPEYQRKIIEKVDKEEVPMILGLGGRGPLDYLESYPLVRQYVAERYTAHYAIPEDNPRGQTFWLLTDSRRQPSGTYELVAGPADSEQVVELPCFR